MGKIVGRNALVYFGGAVAPNKNSVTIAFDRELQEARIFQDVVPGGPWAEQIPGFRTGTIECNGYYDDTDQTQFSPLNANAVQQFVVYESRANLGLYWYGNAWFSFSEEIGVDNVVTFNLSGTIDGPLTRIPLI
jgi:hypothetical protein